MQKLDPVETILARLMPPGLSTAGEREIEEMLDALAGPLPVISTPPAAARPWLRRIVAGGLAAAGVAAAIVMSQPGSPERFVAQPAEQPPHELTLMSESDRVEATTDEGWQEYSDGSAMHAVRLDVVEENRLRDEETGIVMLVSQPREEIFLMPVNAF